MGSARSVEDILSSMEIMTPNEMRTSLAHYGKLGMRWGVRRARISGARSDDAKNVKAIKTKAKATKISSLSNQELQAAITRMNLEKQFSSLNQSRFAKGQKFVKGLLGIGKTTNEAIAFNNSPAGTAIRDGIKAKIK